MKAPAEMPDMYVALQSFEPQRIDYGAPEASGRVAGVQAGFPLWYAVWTLGRMPEANSDEWRAWHLSMRGATRRFIGRDIARPLPKQYLTSGLPVGFDGEADDWSETINADDDSELTLNLGVTGAGVVLSVGDYIGFKWTATETSVAGLEWRAVVRVVEGGTADGSGDVTVVVEPPVPSCVPDTATAHLNQPGCIFALVLDNSSLEAIDRLYSIGGGQITAIQDLRA